MTARSLRVLYRADGGHPIGTGHMWRASRILNALGERVNLDARLLFAEDPFARKVAEATPARPIPLPPIVDTSAVKPRFVADPVLAELARESADLVVVDMLDTPERDMEELRGVGIPLVTFDDRGVGRGFADAIINVLVEEPAPETLRADTLLLQGGPFVALHPVFESVQERLPVREFGPLRRVFVAMGGADAAGLSVKVARALRGAGELDEVQFVCGPAFPHRAELEIAVRDAPWKHSLLASLPGLLDRYVWSDLAIVAGGLTMYEVCCVGAPALAVCQPIDHQLELADRLAATGAMATVGYGEDVGEELIAEQVRALATPDTRRRMSQRGPALVDGKGTGRVADALLRVSRAA